MGSLLIATRIITIAEAAIVMILALSSLGLCNEEYEILKIVKRAAGSKTLSREEKDKIVELHNMYRSNVVPSASNMQRLEWDDNLAELAKGWTEKCTWEHGHPKGVSTDYNKDKIGQNMWIGTARSSDSDLNVDGVITNWNSEVRFYDYDTKRCSDKCGHYTQVVWAKTNKVGCGYTYCKNPTSTSIKNAFLVTCNYYVTGNYAGVKPYLNGTQCTQCPTNGWCKDRLCEPDCTKGDKECGCYLRCYNCGTLDESSCTCKCPEGWSGIDCKEPCEDKSNKCGKGYPKRVCNSQDIVRNECPLMCGECTAPDKSKQCEPTSLPCDDVKCMNGRDPNLHTCKCECGTVFHGDKCQYRQDESRNGVILNFEGDIDSWTNALSNKVKTQVMKAVNKYCRKNLTSCCPDLNPDRQSWQDIKSMNVVLGTGYPEENGGNYDVMYYIKPPVNCKADFLNQDGAYEAVFSSFEDIQSVLEGDLNLVDLKKGQVSTASSLTFSFVYLSLIAFVTIFIVK